MVRSWNMKNKRELVKQGTPRRRNPEHWGMNRLQHFIIKTPKSSYSEKNEFEWTVSICFGGWKVGGEIKQAFDISVMYKGNHLGRMCWWTSSSYILCLSYALYQCMHTPPWNQSQNTLYKLLFFTADGDKASPPHHHWFCLCRIIGNTDVSCDQKESRKEDWLQN